VSLGHSPQEIAKNVIQKVAKSITAIKSTTEMTNNTVYTDKYTVNEHMVNMVASRKATKNMDNAI
jgi:hypothetical protein